MICYRKKFFFWKENEKKVFGSKVLFGTFAYPFFTHAMWTTAVFLRLLSFNDPRHLWLNCQTHTELCAWFWQHQVDRSLRTQAKLFIGAPTSGSNVLLSLFYDTCVPQCVCFSWQQKHPTEVYFVILAFYYHHFAFKLRLMKLMFCWFQKHR